MKILIVEADDERAKRYEQNALGTYPGDSVERVKTKPEAERVLDRQAKQIRKICIGGAYLEVIDARPFLAA